jgi:hypothetical protein
VEQLYALETVPAAVAVETAAAVTVAVVTAGVLLLLLH